jgi:DNA-binding transcriptional ArsR family regulator
MNVHDVAFKAGMAESLLKALANRYRLMVLCELHKGERSVRALQSKIGLTQSALSQHLARLREDGLVTTRRAAQTIYYSLASDDVTKIIALLYKLYCSPVPGERSKEKKGRNV